MGTRYRNWFEVTGIFGCDTEEKETGAAQPGTALQDQCRFFWSGLSPEPEKCGGFSPDLLR
jgi:hypothetical protein